jgi:CSLREA domain-containing protein
MKTLTIAIIACAALVLPPATPAVTFTVDSTRDDTDTVPGDGVCVTAAHTCTLRAAILEANALAGADTITLPTGRYRLSIDGAKEDAGVTGDLDITDDLTITGAGETTTIIDGKRIDRVFDVHGPVHVTLSNLTITNGEAPVATDAGGMLNAGSVTLSHVTFLRNRAGRGEGYAGGLKNLGTATLTQVTFLKNHAGNAYAARNNFGGYAGDVGGMWNEGAATLTDVTFRANRAGGARWGIAGDGGGIWGGAGTITLDNVTITGNHAGNARGYAGGEGGGLSVIEGTTSMTNVTLALNRAGIGRYNAGSNQIAGYATVRNSIIFGRRSCDGYYTGLVSMGHNLDSGTTCGLVAAGDLSNVNPRLDALKSNGGFTQTMALQATSSAIDAGDNAACPATDQRGVARPQGAACDIGAYEFQP